MKNTKTWLVTGASQGLGLATVKYLLSRDQRVIATTRNADKFDEVLRTNPQLEVVSLGLTSEAAVKDAVAAIAEKYGAVDVLINNAGYGFAGAIEEATETEVNQVMAVNFEASIRMTRHVLPVMRRAGKGHIINLSSIQGVRSTPGFGIYNAAKYAVEGYTEALYHEVKNLGIKVTLIEPGAFRTNFLDSSLAVAQHAIADYDATAGNFKQILLANNGKQAGNPEKAVKAIVNITEAENPPFRLLLGEDAYKIATQKAAWLQEEFELSKHITLSTGFDN